MAFEHPIGLSWFGTKPCIVIRLTYIWNMENSLSQLRKFVAPEFIFGSGASLKATQYIRAFGAQKILLVSDEGLVQVGWVDRIEEQLREAGLNYMRYTAVSPNPRDHEVEAGARLFQSEGCDMLLALGGGSPMDCAKGIGALVSNDGDVLDFEGVDNIPLPMPPLLCIPTTAGTSADVSQFAIILDTKRSVKIAIISKGVVPDISLIDPDLTCTMDPELTAETGLDALTHAMEAWVSNASSPVTDIHSLAAMEYLVRWLPEAMVKPADTSVRAGVMMGSLLAGLAFSNASLGIVHAMAHSLGGLLDLPHGLCNALLLEHAAVFNFHHAPQRYRKAAEVLAGRALLDESDSVVVEVLADSLARLRRRLKLGDTIQCRPLSADTLNQLAQRALADPCLVTNPRKPSAQEIRELYARILPV